MPLNFVTEPTDYEDKVTALRLDPKIRYLADVARAVTGETFTRYLERSLMESYYKVSLRVPASHDRVFDPATGTWGISEIDAEEERIETESMTVANKEDLLWSGSEYLRLVMLSHIAPHIVSGEHKALLNYIDNRKDFQVAMGNGYKLDRDKIDGEWEAIKAEFAKTKGKAN